MKTKMIVVVVLAAMWCIAFVCTGKSWCGRWNEPVSLSGFRF